MKSSIIFLVLLSTYCYCEQILGGWSISNDDNLHRDCLNKALLHIHGDQINDEIRSQASDLTCKTQIVNGLNIKCTFTLHGQKWHCSYYKSFVQTLATQLEECKRVEIEQPVVEQKEDKPANEELETANEDDKVEEPVMSNEDDEEEQQVPANKDEKEKQVGQESLIADQNEEDDEAKIDAMNQQMAEQNANHEEEQQA